MGRALKERPYPRESMIDFGTSIEFPLQGIPGSEFPNSLVSIGRGGASRREIAYNRGSTVAPSKWVLA
jgi:hypothetical protein